VFMRCSIVRWVILPSTMQLVSVLQTKFTIGLVLVSKKERVKDE